MYKALSSLTVRFAHWKPHIRVGTKLRHNPRLNLKNPQEKPKTHDFIDFRTLTGNEILYNLQNAKYFRPYEYSNAFLVLGTKKGAPEGYEWETNPLVQTAIGEGKRKIPEYNCKVLTSLAHAWGRLGVKDEELWALLDTHIVRQFTSIESRGLAKSMFAFSRIQTGTKFWEKAIEMLPVHIQQMTHSDVLLTLEALSTRSDVPDETYDKWLYPQIRFHRFKYTPSQLERLEAAFSNRSDFTQLWRDMISEAKEKRYENLKKTKFGGLVVSHDPPPPPQSKAAGEKGKEVKKEKGKSRTNHFEMISL